MSVFVIQNQKWVDPSSGLLVPKFDFTPATDYGEISFIFNSSISPFETGEVINILHDKLQHYTDRDYLLLIGNPVLIGLATAVAAIYNDGKVKFLQWNGSKTMYIPVIANDIF